MLTRKVNYPSNPVIPDKLKEDKLLSKNCRLYMTKLAVSAFAIGFFINSDEQIAYDMSIDVQKVKRYNQILTENRYLEIYDTATDYQIYAPCFLHIYQISGNI